LKSLWQKAFGRQEMVSILNKVTNMDLIFTEMCAPSTHAQ